MWDVDYYTGTNGRKPAKEWIDDQDNSIRPSIDARIQWLRRDGLLLRDNYVLVPIEDRSSRRGRSRIIPGFYELKDRAKKWRIATYYDQKKSMFLFFWGWRKTQRREIDRAIRLLQEYLSREGK